MGSLCAAALESVFQMAQFLHSRQIYSHFFPSLPSQWILWAPPQSTLPLLIWASTDFLGAVCKQNDITSSARIHMWCLAMHIQMFGQNVWGYFCLGMLCLYNVRIDQAVKLYLVKFKIHPKGWDYKEQKFRNAIISVFGWRKM